MEGFERLHPVVILMYYVMAVVLIIWTGNPMLSGIIWLGCILDYACFNGREKAFRLLGSSVVLSVACILVNPIINHRGVTLYFMLGDWRITKESLLYGINVAGVLLASLFLFACFSHYMTAEKIMTLWGQKFSSFALLFSMILRLVPKAGKDFREMTSRLGNRPAVWSALIGITLEDSMERGLSMRSRRYGRGERTSFYKKKMTQTDFVILSMIVLISVGSILYLWFYPVKARFFPSIKINPLPWWLWAITILYYFIPLFLRGKEELSWYLSRQTIIDSAIRQKKETPFESTISE